MRVAVKDIKKDDFFYAASNQEVKYLVQAAANATVVGDGIEVECFVGGVKDAHAHCILRFSNPNQLVKLR